MNVWALVPVKPLDQAKTRLAGALAPRERASLVQTLLGRTLDVLRQTPSVVETLVVTADEDVAAMVSAAGSLVMREAGMPDLNRALEAATLWAQAEHAEAVLVLHADLPLVSVADVEALVACAVAAPAVAVAPDRHGRGTNAMLCAPPGLIEYEFGPDSYALHRAQAQAAGARLEVCSNPGLALDLDTPEDLALLRAVGSGSTLAVPGAAQETTADSQDPCEQGGTQ